MNAMANIHWAAVHEAVYTYESRVATAVSVPIESTFLNLSIAALVALFFFFPALASSAALPVSMASPRTGAPVPAEIL